MGNTKDIIGGLIAIVIGVYKILYYTGYLPLSEEKDKIRQERIRRHGPIATFVCVLMIFMGLMLVTVGIIW